MRSSNSGNAKVLNLLTSVSTTIVKFVSNIREVKIWFINTFLRRHIRFAIKALFVASDICVPFGSNRSLFYVLALVSRLNGMIG